MSDSSKLKVVVGLGNPGNKYAGTRHNVGFEVVDALATGRFQSRFQAQVCEILEGEQRLLLVKPETFMNLSGRSVRQVLDFYQLPLEALLIVADDINLPLGKLRIRPKGTHGGHNGLRDIQSHLGGTDYARVRIGVDAPTVPGEGTVDHVLGRFRPSERPVIEDAVARAVQAVSTWATQGLDVCMNRFNTGGKEKDD